ncbi:Isochorismatase-like protein [Panaeolus papilionaceus]|nr:Isochorismatase-like protein [Panaeolus papilionaceus]
MSNQISADSTIFFLCDIQTKFKPAIYNYNHVVETSNKMIKLAKALDIPVLCTVQNQRALGPTDPDINLESLGPLLQGPFNKSMFSMMIPEVKAVLDSRPNLKSIVIFGIETHICVLQTVLAILADGKYTPYLVADGVSSCNSFEIPIALDRVRSGGGVITTSESIAFELMRDASLKNFKPFSNLIKEVKETTRLAGQALLQGQVTPVVDAAQGEAEIASGGVTLRSAM